MYVGRGQRSKRTKSYYIAQRGRSVCNVPGGSEADVVGEDGGADDIVVVVDGIDAVDDGDAEAGREGEALHAVDHTSPVGRGCAFPGQTAAAVEEAADAELREGAGQRHKELDLGHLACLLLQHHADQQVRHARLHRLLKRRAPGLELPRTLLRSLAAAISLASLSKARERAS